MNGIIDVTTQGITPGSDCSVAFQALESSLTGPARLHFPTGNYFATRPLIISKPEVGVTGDGESLTAINCPGLWCGMSDTDYGATLDPLHRPTVAGILDGSCTTQYGFRTCGTAVLQFPSGALPWGGRSPLDAGTVKTMPRPVTATRCPVGEIA